jgi:hypothetical protein
VAAPGILSELGKAGYYSRPQGVKMHVPNKFPEIPILLGGNGFVAVLKKIPPTFIFPVKISGISHVETQHESTQIAF